LLLLNGLTFMQSLVLTASFHVSSTRHLVRLFYLFV
jgi:hypothetical protein